ncbi:hypothetical protein GCM10017767_30950 [Halomonas urumqiensis]|nr:hypothetical protein GCM10017767_30950 [Halomonas urumqiensis]
MAQGIGRPIALSDKAGRINDLHTRTRRGETPRQAGDLFVQLPTIAEQADLEVSVL